MFFSQEEIEQLSAEYQTIESRYNHLLLAYVRRRYIVESAREHALHGFSRRLKTIKRCIDNVFCQLPPNLDRLPTADELSDTNIYLQTFIFNVFGAVDNLAWIWVHERDTRTRDGARLTRGQVGLRRKNQIVRRSFSPEFQATLDSFDDWFDFNEEYRHAVAHRVPLYVPPYMITKENEAAYQELESRKGEALNQGDIDEYDRLSAVQDDLGVFRPIMTHSIAEGARPVVFHAQMLADFNTVDELACGVLGELDRN